MPGKPLAARIIAKQEFAGYWEYLLDEAIFTAPPRFYGDKASMHAMNVAVISLLMGRCFGFIEEEMQDLGVGAQQV